MKNKITKTMLCGAMAFACAIGGAALLKNDGNVTASAATGTEFAMVNGAAVRLNAVDGKYGIRYTASLGVANKTDLTAKYGENDFYVMIIPEDYITKYSLTASTDLYGDLYTALKAADPTEEPYIATMNALPFQATADDEAQLGLNKDEYYVRGSLTTVQYENLNRDFFGIAYYQDAEENRTYAAYEDNVRNLVNVSSKALNSGAYVDDTEKTNDDWDILRGFVKTGIQSASNGTMDDAGAEAALSSITIQSEVKTLDKAETTVPVNMTAIPEGVDIAVEWATAENETVIEEVQNGNIVPKNWGETTVTAKVLGVSTTVAVKSYKADDWTFDIDEGYEQYYDFVKGTATDDLTSGNFSHYGNAGVASVSDGYLKLTNVPNWSQIVLMNESKLDSYNAGDTVYTQIRMKAVDTTTGEDVSWDTLQMFAFLGTNTFPMLNTETTTKNNYKLTISGEDVDGFKTLTWYAPVGDYWMSNMGGAAKDTEATDYVDAATNFPLMFAGGWSTSGKKTTLLIDWIKTDTVATECTGSVNGTIATSTTYGGKTNANYVSTTATVEGADASTLTLGSRDTAVALAGANGTVTGGSTAGSASITVNSAEGDEIVYGSLGTAEVYTAINCKYDLDMLALAYALGVNETAWSTSAKYMLTQDIDYNGALFIPIAANNVRSCTTVAIGRQWETVLAEGNEYGLSYADFVKKGLNGAWTGTYTDTTYFNATFDGNGFAIKNAKLMLDACIGGVTTGSAAGFATNFIGCLGSNGVLRNISIENLGLQSHAEAGYVLGEKNIVRPVVGADINTTGYTTWTHTIGSAAYYMTCVGVFGTGAGTLENVYAEWNATLDAQMLNRVLDNHAFGRWDGATKMTDCLFVDNFSYKTGGSPYYSILVSSTGGGLTADNVIVVSAHDKMDSGNKMTGTYTQYADTTALQTAYTADNTLFNGFGDWTITLQNNELTCDITNGIAG
ncbi:MAG: hypothetical protein IJZ32_01740 [Clostridia bacterium]|nr:hypothetical protein [Clostridia bacterium]